MNTLAEYVRDRAARLPGSAGDAIRSSLPQSELDAALLARTPTDTLSADVAGLIPEQHLAEIVGLIDSSRPIVESASRTTLDRGTLLYPEIVSTPVVAPQASEKTEAGDSKLELAPATEEATVYLGGGDISWQAIDWSSLDVVALWFSEVARDYALKTESDAAQTIQDAAFANVISSPLGATPTAAQILQAIGDGGEAAVGVAGNRLADTLYVSTGFYWSALVGVLQSALPFGPRIIVSPGLDAGVAVVGQSRALLVAESPGAPVELRSFEPAIGGLEVAIIGGFASVVVDEDAFSMITTAS